MRIKLLFSVFLILFLDMAVGSSAQAKADEAGADSIRRLENLLQNAKALGVSHQDSARLLMEYVFMESCRHGYAPGAEQAIIYLANFYALQGNLNRFDSFFTQALEISNKRDFYAILPRIYIGLGYVSLMKGLKEEAMDYYYKAIQTAEKHVAPIALAKIYSNISANWPEYWDTETAIYYLDKAAAIVRKEKDEKVMVYVMNNRGYIWLRKDIDTALNYYYQALSLARKSDLPDMEYLILTNIGGALSVRSQYDQALSYLQKAQSIQEPVPPSTRALCYNILAGVYMGKADYGRAKHYLLKSIDISKEFKINIYLLENHSTLSEVYAYLGDYKDAYEHQKAYNELTDSLQNKQLKSNLNQLEVKYRTAQKDKENAIHQLKIKAQESNLRKKNIWIGGTTAAGLLLLMLLVAYYRTTKLKRRAQTKQIQFLQQEQEALKQAQEILEQEKEIDQLRAMVAGEEQERKRLSRELHDGIGGMLSAINMNLNAFQQRHGGGQHSKDLHYISGMLNQTSDMLRQAAHNLMPDILLRQGLKAALVQFCAQVRYTSTLQLSLQCHGDLEGLGRDKQLSIYRIIQELVQNIIRHAEAGHAFVQVMEIERQLNITVEDDGQGFDSKAVSKGHGLQNVEFRVKELLGSLTLMSSPGRGTTLLIQCPV